MIKQIINGGSKLKKVQQILLITLGGFVVFKTFPQSKEAILAWIQSGASWATLVDVYGIQLVPFGIGVLFLSTSIATFRNTSHQQSAVGEHPLVRFLNPANIQTLGERPDMKEAVDIIKRKLGLEDRKPLWFPGKKINKLLAEDPEFAHAWKTMHDIAQQNLVSKNRP